MSSPAEPTVASQLLSTIDAIPLSVATYEDHEGLRFVSKNNSCTSRRRTDNPLYLDLADFHVLPAVQSCGLVSFVSIRLRSFDLQRNRQCPKTRGQVHGEIVGQSGSFVHNRVV